MDATLGGAGPRAAGAAAAAGERLAESVLAVLAAKVAAAPFTVPLSCCDAMLSLCVNTPVFEKAYFNWSTARLPSERMV